MTIIASCGHRVREIRQLVPVTLSAHGKDGEELKETKYLCRECAEKARAEDDRIAKMD